MAAQSVGSSNYEAVGISEKEQGPLEEAVGVVEQVAPSGVVPELVKGKC